MLRANYLKARLILAGAALALAATSAPADAGADVYRYVDSAGVPHYTNLAVDRRYKLFLKGSVEKASTASHKTAQPAKWAARAPRHSNFPADSRPYHTEIESVGREHGVDAALIHAVVSVESNYNARAVSRAGAVGLMQLMPGTAARYGVASSRDARGNLDGGVRYLRDLLTMFSGDLRLALAAYNAGEEAVMRFGKGTSIELLLPRAARVVTDPTPTPSWIQKTRQSGAETVLVVEDEDGVRKLAVESLERRGYHVLAAAGGEEALTVASGYEAVIHLLLSDVVMPGIKGPELAGRLRALRPGIRVLLMSGYAADVLTAGDLRDAPFLSKPFSPTTLVQAVRAALDVPLSSTPASQG